MRVRRISIDGFRGVGGRLELDLDRDAVIIVGSNGLGKTTILDALMWGLGGTIPRLGSEDENIVSLYSRSGEAMVTVDLVTASGEVSSVTRRFDGKRQHLSFAVGRSTFDGDQARAELIRATWPAAMSADDSERALTDAVTRSVYLEQDRIRDFIDSADDERFRAFSALIGAGRITDLQAQLDRSRRAWSRATNVINAEVEDLADEVERYRARLSGLRATAISGGGRLDQARAWLRRTLPASSEADQLAETTVRTTIEKVLRDVEERRRRTGLRKRRLAGISELVASLPPAVDPSELRDLAEKEAAARQRVEAAQADYEKLKEEVARERAREERARNEHEELASLARLALRHLEGECPVCGQDHDAAATRSRLLGFVALAGRPLVPDDLDVQLKEALSLIESADRDALAAGVALRESARRDAERRPIVTEIELGFAELELHPVTLDEIPLALDRELAQLEERDSSDEGLATEGNDLVSSFGSRGQLARQAEIEQSIQHAESELTVKSEDARRREATTELAASIQDALRDASAQILQSEVATVEPIIQRIFQTAGPHPSLRRFRFDLSFFGGRGRIETHLTDGVEGVRTRHPEWHLSSSQLNVLAVAIFLGLNLGLPRLPLDAAVLDDPLQSLDDVNLLGLLDLLRRTKEHRQLIITTHDRGFAGLLRRKLRPAGDASTCRLVKLTGWRRDGPLVETEEILSDKQVLHFRAG